MSELTHRQIANCAQIDLNKLSNIENLVNDGFMIINLDKDPTAGALLKEIMSAVDELEKHTLKLMLDAEIADLTERRAMLD